MGERLGGNGNVPIGVAANQRVLTLTIASVFQ
jgi:hypothetical protein